MNVPTIAAKNAPIVLPVLTGTMALDTELLIQIIAVSVGLVFGGMWRAGSLASDGKSWGDIRTDLVISMLIGGANAVLALAMADMLNLTPILAMALGVILGATGLRALPQVRDALMDSLRRKLIGDDIVVMQPKDKTMQEHIEELRDDN